MIKVSRFNILLQFVLCACVMISCKSSVRFYDEINSTYGDRSFNKVDDIFYKILEKCKDDLQNSDEVILININRYDQFFDGGGEVLFLYDVTNKKSYKFFLNEEYDIDSVSYDYDEKSYEAYIVDAYLENRMKDVTSNNALKQHSGAIVSSVFYSVNLKEGKVFKLYYHDFAFKDGKPVTSDEFDKILREEMGL